MPRKGRARRFREARELKQGFDDGLFSEGNKTLADLESGEAEEEWDDDEEQEEQASWDPDAALQDPVRDAPSDAGGRRAS